MAEQKQYLIQFLATMQGDKMVVSGLKSMEKATKKNTAATDKNKKAMKSWNQQMVGLAKRALMVAPIWMLMRGAIMMVTNTIREVIQANLDLQVQMARIKTVVSASSTSIESDMSKIREAILNMSAKTTASVKDLAEAFYFLRTSNLSTEEAIAAFAPSVNLAIGTLNKLGETARTVAGIYATLGDYMGENLTLTEKFTQIADGLAFTYATQEVQMSELLQSYIKFAPYISGLKESWTEIITVLGYLNTKQLKAGRSGRLMGRMILQIIKNSSKLAHIFGITFAPEEPISFLKLLKTINKTLDVQGKITSKQSKALQAVFATRGGVPPRLLLSSFKELTGLIEEAEKNMSGFAEKMSNIMQRTVPAQMQRTKNILAILSNEFFSAAAGSGDFVDVLVKMNDSFEDMRQPIKEVGLLIGWLTDNILEFSKVFELMPRSKNIQKTLMENIPQFGGLLTTLKQLSKLKILPFDLKTYDEYVNKVEESNKVSKKKADLHAKMKSLDSATSKALLDNLKSEKTAEKEIISLMKKRGATELEIAEFKIKNFADMRVWMTEEETFTKQLTLINDKINAQYLERIKHTQSLIQHHQKLYEMYGADSVEAAKLNYEIQKILFGESDITRTLQAKLNLEREILTAKREQHKYTSDETKLMEVYLKYGEDIARTMARVVTGQTQPKQLEKGELTAFKEFFPERAESEDIRKFYEEGAGRFLESILERQEKRERARALSDARRLQKAYTTAPITEKQIKMEIGKITLPQPVDVNVKAEIIVDVNKEQLENDIIRIVNKAIRSTGNKKYIQKQLFDAEE